jgi:hypothetical protein
MLCTSGELVEKGVMRRLPEGFDGNKSPYVFTWSNERPNKVISRCGFFRQDVLETKMG